MAGGYCTICGRLALYHMTPCPRPPQPDLPQLLKTQRGLALLSLQDVASAASLTKAHVWELEAGRSANPSVSTIDGLATALGLPVETVFAAALRSRRAAVGSAEDREP